MKLTKTSVPALKLPPGKGELIIFDDALPGFGLRLRDGGSRNWIVQYKVGRKQRRMTIGRLALLDVAQARAAARDVLAKVRLHGDPAAERAAAKAKAHENFAFFTAIYLADQKPLISDRWYADTERYLNVLWKPLHGLTLAQIDRVVIAGRLRKIALENGATTADRARASLSAFFSWAMQDGIAAANPVIGTRRSVPKGEGERDRVLNDVELVAVWNALGNDHFGSILKLLILTGQRREEIGGLGWPEFHPDKRLVSLSGERTKNGEPHDVPLSDATLAILEAQPRRAGRDWMFGEGKGGFQGYGKCKAALDRKLGEGFESWRLHDIRRTVSTGMHELGVLPHVVEAVLNHISGHRKGVAGTYNLAVYANEKRVALDMWGGHVMQLVEGQPAKVVSIAAKRA